MDALESVLLWRYFVFSVPEKSRYRAFSHITRRGGSSHMTGLVYILFVLLYPSVSLMAGKATTTLNSSGNCSHFVNGTVTALCNYMGVDHQFAITFSKRHCELNDRKKVID